MTASSSSKDMAPFSRWPLTKKVGVESTYSESKAYFWSAFSLSSRD